MLAKLTRGAILLILAATFVVWIVTITKNGETAPANDAPVIEHIWA